jgi:hypothetical protein
VLDAYCQHRGANMGVGGTVEGENIVCPWHGWHWDGDGNNTLIPYSKIGCKQNVKVKTNFYAQASVREPGDTGDKPGGRALKFLQLQQEVIKQDFFTWENMKYLEKPNLAPEEARDYAALRRWAHRFYPGPEPTPIDFGYTADGEPDPAAAHS